MSIPKKSGNLLNAPRSFVSYTMFQLMWFENPSCIKIYSGHMMKREILFELNKFLQIVS